MCKGSLKNGRQGADTISRGRECVKKCGRGPKQLTVVRDTCMTMKMGAGSQKVDRNSGRWVFYVKNVCRLWGWELAVENE